MTASGIGRKEGGTNLNRGINFEVRELGLKS